MLTAIGWSVKPSKHHSRVGKAKEQSTASRQVWELKYRMGSSRLIVFNYRKTNEFKKDTRLDAQ